MTIKFKPNILFFTSLFNLFDYFCPFKKPTMITLRINLFICFVLVLTLAFGQESNKVQELDSVVITSTRIDLPFPSL